MPVPVAVTVPERVTVTLPVLLVKVTSAKIPTPPTALTSPDPPTVTEPLVPATLLTCCAVMPLPAVLETRLPPVTVMLPVPKWSALMPNRPVTLP